MKKPKPEPPAYERPLLMELIYECANLFAGPTTVEQWNEVFYNLSLQENAPTCLKELKWETKDGVYQSRDLNDLLSFCVALQKMPGNIR